MLTRDQRMALAITGIVFGVAAILLVVLLFFMKACRRPRSTIL
jgi:hypothetical protein